MLKVKANITYNLAKLSKSKLLYIAGKLLTERAINVADRCK